MTRHRPGLSLTEVLVTLFIMGLGTIAILTLFPLGALNMAQAMRDDRTTQAAGQADAYLRWYYQANVVEQPLVYEPFAAAMTDPNDGLPLLSPLRTGDPVALPAEPSYPVFVDPMGRVARPAGDNEHWWAGYSFGYQYRSLPRRNVKAIADLATTFQDKPAALRVCSLLDGLTFDPTNGGQPGNGSAVDREYRYNWLWVLQRPVAADRNNVNLTVVVFDKRTHLYAPKTAATEFAFSSVRFTPGATSVEVPADRGVVLQKGGWVMDGTAQATLGLPVIRHAIFYRIASATPSPTDSTRIVLELQTPIRRLDGRSDPATDFYDGTLIVLGGVADVFERPPVSAAPFANQ